jgi:urocanate hydratase
MICLSSLVVTLLNTARLYLGVGEEERSDGRAALAGLVYVSSGLGGMSGAQPKAANIAGAVSIIAEVLPLYWRVGVGMMSYIIVLG